MKKNDNLLDRIYRNTQMGIETLPLLASKAQDTSLKGVLHEQWTDYKQLNRKAAQMMRSQGMAVRDISEATRMSSTAMTNMKTLMDRSTSHLAEMAIEGSNMGITKITKAIHDSCHSDKKAISLAEDLLKTEERNLKELREFL